MRPKDTFQVLVKAQVIAQTRPAILPRKGLLTELDSGHAPEHEPDVKRQESRCQDKHNNGDHKTEHQDEARVGCGFFNHRLLHRFAQCQDDEEKVEDCVDHQEKEELVISKTDAVHDPGAVVIHSQHAGVAYSTVMATVELEPLTPFAETPLPSRALLFVDCQVVGVSQPIRIVGWCARVGENTAQKTDGKHRGEELRDNGVPDESLILLQVVCTSRAGHVR